MLNISGRQTSRWLEYGYETKKEPLYVSCAGYQEFLTMDYAIRRPNGRCDYQLIYIYKGKGTFHFPDGDRVVEEGSLLVFSPGQPQVYEYQARDGVRLFWLHFTGSEAEKRLEEAHLRGGSILHLGVQEELAALFFRIIRELQEKPPMFCRCVEGCFSQLLAMILRMSETASGPDAVRDPDISRVVKQMHLVYRQEYRPEYYASLCGLSVQSFIHKFTRNMGVSPGKYLARIRMEEAAHLLRDTAMSVQEVSAAVGYDNPLYFSRVFSAWAGKSPTLYREELASGRGDVS